MQALIRMAGGIIAMGTGYITGVIMNVRIIMDTAATTTAEDIRG